jgi:hypothetical protein
MMRVVRRTATVLLAAMLTVAGLASSASALRIDGDPNDPPSAGGGPDPFVPPTNGFTWGVSSRFGSTNPATGLINFHWNQSASDDHPGDAYTYDPNYVHPGSQTARFDGCPTAAEETAAANNSTSNTYKWELVDPGGNTLLAITQNNCTWSHDFTLDPLTASSSPVTVYLTVTDPLGGVTQKHQSVTIKDYLVVSLGDSYASGEGSPDVPQTFDSFGFVKSGAQWEDRRCHRSAHAPSAQAALSLEAADPHSSVTFLSFACSGATISTDYFADTSKFDPFRPGGTNGQGTGVLDKYVGAEPPDPNNFKDKLDSQIDQLGKAVTSSGAVAARHIDALTLSAGGNDMGFGPVAQVCTLYSDCANHRVMSSDLSGRIPLSDRFQQAVATMSGRYSSLAGYLARFDIGRVYLTEYPNPSTASDGSLCAKMLDDVIPGWMQPLLAPAALIDGSDIPVVPFQVDGGEVGFAGGTVLSGMNGAVSAGAAAHGWTLVDGIADAKGNLFAGHGYCASDNWIRRGPEASTLQGPWDAPLVCNAFTAIFGIEGFLINCVPPATSRTKGVLHPTSDGYQAIAGRLSSKVLPDLLPPPPSQPPPPGPAFSVSTSQSVVGAKGWLIGHQPDQSCPADASDCAILAASATADTSTAIRGVALTVNGAATPCTAVGATTNGVICGGKLGTNGAYQWTLRFPNDGIYQLSFVATDQNQQVSRLDRSVKVDLHDPNAPTVTPATAASASGWYQAPVTVVLDGTDSPGGSGVQGITYQLDGDGPVTVQPHGQLQMTGEGIHSLSFTSSDVAGRHSTTQSFTVKIDQTAPSISCGSADGAWHPNDVNLPCTATDTGSGLPNAGDATFSLATNVPANTESADAPTATRPVCDVAGNCATAGPLRGNHIDKKSPMITIGSPTAGPFYVGQSVTAAYNCTDGGSGVARCDGTVPNGAAIDSASAGSKSFSVQSADVVGNSSSASAAYTVNPAPTTTTLSSSSDPSQVGQPVTFIASLAVVAPGSGNPTGTVGFTDNGSPVAGCTHAAVVGGKASCTVTYGATGAHSMVGAYSGDRNFLTSTSAPLGQTAAHCGSTLSTCNLSGANLTNANLSGDNLSSTNLTSATLIGANLSSANLTGAKLSGANLTGANLTGANLSGANLSGVHLTGANLSGANLTNTNLKAANLSGANLRTANLNGANMSEATLSETTTVLGVIWSNTLCPDGSNSNNDGGSCVGHL